VVEHCEREGIVFIPWFPLASGKVANMLPIPGTSSIEHLEENLGAASLQLTEEEYRELISVSEPPPSFRG
jgi:pyridoxine 4-dehydrogenase